MRALRARVARWLSALLCVLGIALLAAMAFLSSWPDMEASVFDPDTTLSARAPMRELRCPLVISAGEQSDVHATFRNPSDRTTSFLVRTRISRGFVTLIRQDSSVVELGPGESRTLSWPVSAADAAYHRLILVRVYAAQGAGAPPRQTACGILVVGVPAMKGDLLFLLGVVAGFALLAIGAAWWFVQRRPLGMRDEALARGFGALALIVLGSLAAGVAGWWLLSHGLLLFALIVVGALLERFALR